MHSAALKRHATLAEYLAFERDADEKHILWDGEIFPMWGMAGGSPAQNAISANVVIAVGLALRGGPCRPFNSDQKIWVPLKGGIVYPDVSIVCGRLELLPGTTDVVTNPEVIVEVLSPGTEAFDRAEKFAGYRTIASLRHYLMVASTGVGVEHYARGADGSWTLRDYGADGVITLASPDLTLRVADLYLNAFDEPA